MRYFSLLIVCTVTACASKTPAPDPVEKNRMSPIEERLSESASLAADALTELSQIKKTLYPHQEIDVDPGVVPAELKRRVVLPSYEGPAIPLLDLLAREAGYTLRLLGAPNAAAPIEVNIRRKEATLNDFLRDIHLQSGRKAAVTVRADQRVIEYRIQNNG